MMPKGDSARRIADTADTLGSIVETVCGGICVFCYAVMTLTAILGVFFRYVMQSPFMWTEEVARYLLVWLGFTAISMALRQNRHIKVDVMAAIAPPVVQKSVAYVVDVLVALFFVVLFWQGWLMTKNNIMVASTLPVSMTWIYAALPVAALLALFQHGMNVIRKTASRFVPDPDREPEGTGEERL
jgi:TRAP-type C4-dicarboxylate transport system permease small subunit